MDSIDTLSPSFFQKSQNFPPIIMSSYRILRKKQQSTCKTYGKPQIFMEMHKCLRFILVKFKKKFFYTVMLCSEKLKYLRTDGPGSSNLARAGADGDHGAARLGVLPGVKGLHGARLGFRDPDPVGAEHGPRYRLAA